MPLAAGTYVGPYEIVGSLGAGGMGEVYRARDARLNREVALKIVPAAFAGDADRLARFQREAQLLASLSHPNIAAIYGLEDYGTGKALVLELVDGETLADRIARGPIPLDEALPLARQIAEALESAHEQGVIHRDLKPANIKLREDGTVKVLDFGLAKMLETETPSDSSSLSLSPTITTPAMTQMGMILGTAAYMAPEQARGKSADRRSDVWAFGCVLFEMLTGKQAFAGEDVTDIIAAVVRGEAPWQALPADTPASIRLLLQRCLEKDRRKRIGDISGVLFVLREPSLGVSPDAPVATMPTPVPARRSWSTVAAVAVALTLVGALSAGVAWTLKRTDSPPVSRLVILTGEQQVGRAIPGHHIAVAPDASAVVYIGVRDTAPALFARRLDAFESTLLAQPALSPFFRPDGKEVGYFNQGIVRRVAITGGPSVEIVRIDGQFRGATWGSNDSIVFAMASPKAGLRRVSAGGGEPEVLTEPEDDVDHILPRFLPDGNVLFTIVSGTTDPAASQVAVLDMRSSPPQIKVLFRGGSDAHYLSSGHLLYLAGDSFRLVGFDLSRLELTDEAPTPVLSNMAMLSFGYSADVAVSASGTAAYVRAAPAAASARTLVLVDRNGTAQPLTAQPRSYLYPRFSPDETRVAVDVRDGENDIWVWNLQQRNFTKITQHSDLDRTPVWADNDSLFYSSMMEGTPSLFRQRADGTGQPEKITEVLAAQPLFPLSMAGNLLIVSNTVGGVGIADLMTLEVTSAPGSAPGTSPSKPAALPALKPLVSGPEGAINGIVSPDGRWLTYQSNESDTWEVYVQPFGAGATGPRQTISTMGGIQPRWSANGQELFYVSPRSEMMVVKVRPGNTWTASPPQLLFDASDYFFGGTGSPFWMYDIARNGRFLMVKAPEAANVPPPSDHIYVIQNWIEELKRRAAR